MKAKTKKAKANKAKSTKAKSKNAGGKGNPNANYVMMNYGGSNPKLSEHYRGEVKTSFIRDSAGRVARAKDYNTLTQLRTEYLDKHPDKDMKGTVKDKKNLTGKFKKERTEEENMNITFTAWLYASRLETDNDFHIILGDTASKKSTTRLLNVEVCGLPPAGRADYNDILQTRKDFIELFPHDSLYDKYIVPKTPIKVEVTGSLFYDGEHEPNKIGPIGLRPDTVWELHPIISIKKA